MPHQGFKEAFEDLFDVEFAELGQLLVGTIRTMDVQVRLDPQTSRLSLSTLVRDAHDGVPQAYLMDLLCFNLPNDFTGPFFLAERSGSGHLELTGTIPFASLAVADLERLVLDHWTAALTISDRLGAHFQAHAEEH